MADPGITLWAVDVAERYASLDAWLGRLEVVVAGAAGRGSSLVVLPEYACVSWLAWAPDALIIGKEVAWLAGEAAKAHPAIARIASKHGVAIIPGTAPSAVGDRAYANRAVLHAASGASAWQDKVALTKWELARDGWLLEPGRTFKIVRWNGLRVAIAICLDVEAPAIASALVPRGVDLLVVPSMTAARAGYERVFACSKARAIELSCPVAVVGAIGTLSVRGREETNVSGAAVFWPCESDDDELGIVEEIGPFGHDASAGAGTILDAILPIEACRRFRRGFNDVWPARVPADLAFEDVVLP